MKNKRRLKKKQKWIQIPNFIGIDCPDIDVEEVMNALLGYSWEDRADDLYDKALMADFRSFSNIFHEWEHWDEYWAGSDVIDYQHVMHPSIYRNIKND